MARQRRTTAKPAADKEVPSATDFLVPVRWEGADDVPIVFVNNIFVRFMDGQFLVTMGQAHGPYVLADTPEALGELQEKMKEEGVGTRVIARLAVSPARMALFIQHLNTVYSRWEQGQQPKPGGAREERGK